MLHVVNQKLDANFDPAAFDYVAEWNESRGSVEMGLRATRPMRVHIERLDLDISFFDGEMLHNEISCKFTRRTASRELEAAGMTLAGWYTDRQHRFALALARPA